MRRPSTKLHSARRLAPSNNRVVPSHNRVVPSRTNRWWIGAGEIVERRGQPYEYLELLCPWDRCIQPLLIALGEPLEGVSLIVRPDEGREVIVPKLILQ